MFDEKIEINKFLLNECLDLNRTIQELKCQVIEKDRTINELNREITSMSTEVPKTNTTKDIFLPIGLNIITGIIFGASAGFVFKQFMPF